MLEALRAIPTYGKRVQARIALFPLGMVLVPGLLLPLHIFEERYRLLIRDLVELPDDEPRHFGVVAIRGAQELSPDGSPAVYDVGCTAELRRVEPYEDGRFDILSTGQQRFRIGAIDGSRPYWQADVELLDEPPGHGSDALTGPVSRAFFRYLETISSFGPAIKVPGLPEDPQLLSYVVAATVLADVPERQSLLAAPDTAARLHAELALLRAETALVRATRTVPGFQPIQ